LDDYKTNNKRVGENTRNLGGKPGRRTFASRRNPMTFSEGCSPLLIRILVTTTLAKAVMALRV